ncbi:hypothetical protein GCM10023200_57120 [Actinomycetospora chlora]|uniref:WXG100 family type VII secretion target n=2 Tax=Actinomycetospora chlora TaxID=663608 RepID=A0ABP9CPA2_9PSEU
MSRNGHHAPRPVVMLVGVSEPRTGLRHREGMRMTGGRFSTDTATMQSVAQQISTIHTTMEADLARLRQQLSTLAGQEWQGAAATAFGTTMATWDRDAMRMNQALDAIASKVNRSAGLLESDQDRGARAFHGVDTGTGQAGGLGRFL